jgi:thymidylate kinase
LDVASIIEGTANGQVLVVGSLPPAGRDWDLLIDDSDRDALEAQLPASGFVALQGRWVRPSENRPDVVELIDRAQWKLPEHEARRLFADAVPLDGRVRLCVPSPSDSLLILARKLPRMPGFLEERQRQRVRAALSDDPAAFAKAREHAPAWGVERRLRRLQARYLNPARARWRPPFLHRPRRGAIIAFSGLDGVGKSTQTQALATSLGALGYEAEVVWTPIGQTASLRRFARIVKLALSRLPVGPLAGARGAAADAHILSRAEPGARAFGPSRMFASHVWSTATTLANGIAFRRAARGARRGGRIAIYDRYVLDTVVELRFCYAPEGRLRIQELLVRALAPAPARAYFLDAAPEVAHRRKPDWSLDQTRLRAALYRREHAALGVTRIDGGRPADEISGEILRQVLDSLPG